MKTFTRIVSLMLIALSGWFAPAVQAQSILNPTDSVITYNPAAPPASPAWGTIGKWIRTVRLGWNTTNFKCYVYNGIPFRLRFPKSYNPTANDGKKYPVMIFWHGSGEGGPATDNEYQLFHGGQVFDNAVSSGTFDGYVIAMQSSGGGWGEPAYSYMQTILNYMIANNKLDPFHITVNGLSAGGAGTWDWTINYTNMTAASVPMSMTSLAYLQTAPANLKYTPVWLIQGGLDGSPDPSTSIQLVNAMNNVGCDLTYTIFPNDGHDTWDDTWAQPNFWPFLLAGYASNPWALFGRTQFCPGDTINITVGVTQGFQAYQWRMNGNVITAATSNTINVTQLGTYDARVESNGIWSDWSHTPLIVSIKQPTVSPNITIPALTSNVVPALDTSHGVTLQVPTGYASYLWQQVGNSTTLSTTNTLSTSTPGNYQVKVTEQFGCSSSFSNPYTVINAAGANKPSPASGLTITTVSQTALRLDWTVNPSQQYPQTGFEVYQGTQPGGPYKLIALLGPNAVYDTATGLNPAGKYYYVVRAVNGSAAAAASNEGVGTTASDSIPPTAPVNLLVTGTTRTSVSLSWTASTDNVGVTSYDIYVNGVKAYSTTGTSFTVNDLQYNSSYAFAVTARDFARNISPFSNQVTAIPLQTGYSYKYYLTNGNWNTLQNLSTMTPTSTGYSISLDLSSRTQDINFAYLWQGYIHIPTTGTYYFQTNSDDGSMLWLGSLGQTSSAYNFGTAATVNNDGLHGTQNANSVALNLTAGVYPIAIAYYQQGGGFSVTASWSTPQTGAGNFVPIPLSALSDVSTVTGTAPAAPSNLVATAVSYKKVSLSWSDNSSNETAFEIWRATDSLGTTAVTVATVAANKTSFTDSTLSASTKYFYRVRAINQYGQSAFDNPGPGIGYSYYSLSYSPSILPSPATLMSTVPTATGQVTTISVAPATSTVNFILAFSGTINIPTAGSYTFYTSSDDGSDLYIGGTDSAHLVVRNDFLQGQTERSGTVTLTAGAHSIYVPYFQAGGGFVVTASIQGPGIAKEQIPASLMGQPFASATTLPLPVIPAAPTGFVSHGTSTTSSVTMSWTDNANNESNYQVYRSSNNNTNYLLLATLPANTVSYKDSGLFANATYYYKVRAVNPGGNSAFSNEDSAHTADHLPVLAAITAAQYMHYGTQLVLPVTATDADPETLTIGVTGLPAFAVFAQSGSGVGTITFNSTASTDQGVYNNITVTVNDQHGGSATSVFSLTVNSNYNPVITRPVANVSVNEKQTAAVSLSATDQNTTDVLTWSFTGLPAFATPVTSGGSATLNLAPGYADGGSYAVQARVNDGNHGFDTLTFMITVVPVALPTTSTYIHFSDGSAGTLGAAPWNNTAAVPVQGLVFSGLLDQNAAISGISLTITTPWQNISLPNGTNTYGVNTGNNSGVYPDAVLSSAYYTDGNNQIFKVSGLDTASKYNFTFLGSRGNVSDDRTTIYTVTTTSGATSVSLQAANNSTNTVSVNNVKPNADSTLTITLAKGASAPYGYLNALVITKQFNDHTAPVRSRSITGQFVNGNHVALTWVPSAYNANAYQVYRSAVRTGPYTLLNPGASNPTQSSYNDSTISQNNTYYYYVTSSNSYGVSPSSDTVTMVIPDLPPVLAPVAAISLQAGKTATAAITATDAPADVITLQASGLPGFASFTDNGNGSGTLTMNPAASDIGTYTGAITATDNHGASSVTPVSLTVAIANLRNVYINFNDGSSAEPAQAAPWNNMNSTPNAGAGITNMKDDSATATGIGIKLVDTWTGANNVGPNTGNNSGVYPDNVMQSLYYDGSGTPRHISLTGLSSKGKYNLIFYNGRAGVTDDRITDYTVGSQTVALNGASNTSQTVSINSISPDATGTITISVMQDPGAPFTYINAMQLQYSFDTTFYAPSSLVTAGPSTSTIRLNWVSNAPATTTGFEIWRSSSQAGPFTLLATVGDTTSYTDGGLSTGTSFFYEVRALAGTRASSFSNIAGGSTVAYSVDIQMNDGSQSPAQGGYWNSINTLMFPGYLLPNMINTQYQPTGINYGMLTNFTGYNIVGTTTGNNTGIFPDNVMQGLYYVNFGDTAKLFVSGLNLTSTYNFNFFGSRVTPTTSVISNYQIGNQIVTLDATNNTTKTVQIAGVHPDSTGTIYFQLFNSDGGRAYLNALTIDGVPSATSTIDQTPVATQAIRNGGGQGAGTGTGTAASLSAVDTSLSAAFSGDTKVSAFPNPFVDEISLSLQLSRPVAKLLVQVTDISGRVLFGQEMDNLPQGISQQQLSLNAGNLPAGTYFVILKGLPDGGIKTIQLIKLTK